MNDFSELENELKKLRPAQPTAELIARIDAAFTNQTTGPHLNPLSAPPSRDPGADAKRQVRVTHAVSTEAGKVIHPARFKVSWLSLGAGLAAAAVFLIFARIGGDHPSKQSPRVAQNTPAPHTGSTINSAEFIPAGATHVLYSTRDEGLHFRNGSAEPVRRMRYQKRETLQWNNPKTGASLRVSYPSEEVVLTPVSGQ